MRPPLENERGDTLLVVNDCLPEVELENPPISGVSAALSSDGMTE